MITEDVCPALVGRVPPPTVEAATARISNLTKNGLEGLQGAVFKDMEQFRVAMTEAGYTTGYKPKKISASETAALFVAQTTCKDGSQWESILWEFGTLGERLTTFCITVQTKKPNAPDEDSFGN